jgi:hypothetical protein
MFRTRVSLPLIILLFLNAVQSLGIAQSPTDGFKHKQNFFEIGDNNSTEQKDWADAVKSCTEESFETFLKNHSAGNLADRAKALKRVFRDDLVLRAKDKVLLERFKAKQPSSIPKIETAMLGSDYALLRSLTASEKARAQFETPTMSLSVVGCLNTLKANKSWPPKDWPPKGISQDSISNSLDQILPFRDLFKVWPPKGEPIQFTGFQVRPEGLFPGDDKLLLVTILEGDSFFLLTPTKTDGLRLDFFSSPSSGPPLSMILIPTGGGSIHIFKGNVNLFGLQFKGSDNDPLRFVIGENGDYQYFGGTGSVLTKEGKVLLNRGNEP